jgi:hypothetical protein
MRSSHAFRASVAAAALTLAPVVGPTYAQVGAGPHNPAAPAPEATDAGGVRDYGWIGVFGLLGLLGVVGARKRPTSRGHDFAGGRSTSARR